MMNNEKEKDAIDTSKLDEILPKYDPLKLNSINLAQNYVSAFNTGMNIYQCVNQLQGYIEWVVKAVNDVVKSWNVQVGESIDQSKAIVRETTTEQFNTEWTNKQPELIEQVNTLTTNQFNEDWGVLENRINTNFEKIQDKIRINYLRPTLQTASQNGVTCTNNGDGTYTINGTATSLTVFCLGECKLKYGKYKILGTPNVNGCSMGGTIHNEIHYDGVILEQEINGTVAIIVDSGITVNNAVFKPMITDDLSATYDDFVSGFDCFTPDIKMDLLWTNASPKSEFYLQTISLDLSHYKTIIILFVEYIERDNYINFTFTEKINYGPVTYVATVSTPSITIFYRNINITDTSIIFGESGYNDSAGSHGASGMLVPYKIYGVK